MTVEPFKCIVADPPWNEAGGGKCKRGADRWYPLMKTKEIIKLLRELLFGGFEVRGSEVFETEPTFSVAENAHLHLWCTNNYLPDGLDVMNSLGFRYINNTVWVKATPERFFDASGGAAEIELWKLQNPGLGQYKGGQHELLLFGVMGKLPALWKDKTSGKHRPGSVIMAPRGKHSEKPVEAYEHIENITPGPYLELFVRGQGRPGWTVWGNEAER